MWRNYPLLVWKFLVVWWLLWQALKIQNWFSISHLLLLMVKMKSKLIPHLLFFKRVTFYCHNFFLDLMIRINDSLQRMHSQPFQPIWSLRSCIKSTSTSILAYCPKDLFKVASSNNKGIPIPLAIEKRTALGSPVSQRQAINTNPTLKNCLLHRVN